MDDSRERCTPKRCLGGRRNCSPLVLVTVKIRQNAVGRRSSTRARASLHKDKENKDPPTRLLPIADDGRAAEKEKPEIERNERSGSFPF